MKLGELLVSKGMISQEQLEEALSVQGPSKLQKPKLGKVLVEKKYISEVQLAEAIALQLDIPFCSLDRDTPRPEAIATIGKEVAERLQCIPIMLDNDILSVAMSDPGDFVAQDELRRITGKQIKHLVATQSDIQSHIEKIYNIQANLSDAISESNEFLKRFGVESTATSFGEQQSGVSNLVWSVLQQAVRDSASDIHIECFEEEGWIRYRVDGKLIMGPSFPPQIHQIITSRLKIMANMDTAEKRKPQDGRIMLKVDNKQIDFRVSSLPTRFGEKMVLRILDQDNTFVGLERLGLTDHDMQYVKYFCGIPWGILLVTGPTGSGKSTTLYSILHEINKLDTNIITVEDPVEYTVKGINQVHVNEKAGMTFPAALRSILRQDPDKIMIGEIRDAETARIAIHASLTGHLVLSTLHTNDAPSAATRLIDMGIEPFLVASALSGVIAQRLVRRLCPLCRQRITVDARTAKDTGLEEGTVIYQPGQCNNCRGGYKGRLGLYEIMPINRAIKHQIMKSSSDDEIRNIAVASKMITLRDAGLRAVRTGLTSLEEVLTATI